MFPWCCPCTGRLEAMIPTEEQFWRSLWSGVCHATARWWSCGPNDPGRAERQPLLSSPASNQPDPMVQLQYTEPWQASEVAWLCDQAVTMSPVSASHVVTHWSATNIILVMGGTSYTGQQTLVSGWQLSRKWFLMVSKMDHFGQLTVVECELLAIHYVCNCWIADECQCQSYYL